MRTMNLHKLILFFLLFILPFGVFAQITIGADLPPNTGALLDLKQWVADANMATANKGLGVPRMALTSLNTLSPLVGDPAELTGALVYNVDTIYSEHLCPGLHVWKGDSWQSLSGLNTIKDSEGNIYRTAKFGAAGTWMIENLRSRLYSDGSGLFLFQDLPSVRSDRYYNLPNLTDTTPLHGYLYTWAAATNLQQTDVLGSGQAGTRPSIIQGICPEGWVLPSDYDWTLLEQEIANNPLLYSTFNAQPWDPAWATMDNIYQSGNQKERGDFYKSMISTIKINGQNTGGASSDLCGNVGFNALLLGCVHNTATPVESYGTRAYFWTSSSYDTVFKWFRSMDNLANSNGVNRYFRSSSSYMFSVRCKKME